MKRRILIGCIFTFFALLAMAAPPGSAHPPSNMTLVYDLDTKILEVTVSHSVSDVNTHYISRIEVSKNDVQYTSRDYTSQASISGMSDSFTVDASAGDVLQVQAICSISGSITRQLTITENGTTTPPPPAIPGFPLAALIIGALFAIGYSLVRRRPHLLKGR